MRRAGYPTPGTTPGSCADEQGRNGDRDFGVPSTVPGMHEAHYNRRTANYHSRNS
jgi:hypothetical protein